MSGKRGAKKQRKMGSEGSANLEKYMRQKLVEVRDKIKNAPTETLIQFLAVHQALKINKEMAIQVMLELDKRRVNGEILDLSQIDRLSDLLKFVGSGKIIKIIQTQINNIQNTLNEKNITTIKISPDRKKALFLSEKFKHLMRLIA